MKVRLVIADVDGTLITGDRRVTGRTAAAFARARAAGIRVTLATGRTFNSALPYARAIGADAPMVVYNGARLMALDGAVLREWRLDAALARVVLDELASVDAHVTLFHDDALYIREWNDWARGSAAKDGVNFEAVGDLRAHLDRAPLKMMIISEPAALDGLRPKLLAAYAQRGMTPPALVRSEPTYLEVWNGEASKGVATAALAESLGIAMSEVAAFGDSLNDVELIRSVGHGVAMGNAHPDLKRIARGVTASNEEDGVAAALEELLGAARVA